MREIPLTQGKVALVDDQDYERVITHRWCAVRIQNNWYAKRTSLKDGTRTTLYMHQFLHPVRAGFMPDHIDGNGLNNQRSNLRKATPSINASNAHTPIRNKHGFIGTYVDQRAPEHRFGAQIRIRGTIKSLGHFATVEEAAKAYDRAKVALYGPNVRLNFPEVA